MTEINPTRGIPHRQGDTPDVLRAIAVLEIGANAPWLADELHDFADRLAAEMHGEMPVKRDTSTPEQMLREFHASKAIHGGLMPEQPTADIPVWVQMLRISLLDEEVRELAEAVEAGDIVKIADAIGDIAYVAVGTAVTYGIPFDAVFAEVHRSNMTKINTPAEAKLVKGPDYQPPDIARVLADPKLRAAHPAPGYGDDLCHDPAACANGPLPHSRHHSCWLDRDGGW